MKKLNILFLSKLSGKLVGGPSNSVPAQINAQRKIDNVFWYNMNEIKLDSWVDIGCKNIKDYPSGKLSDLPKPFDNPDLGVIEEFYRYPFSSIVKEIQRKKIPYIIIPRSQMTEQAQKKKFLKKFVCNLLYFNSFAKKATAIQYLSKQEKLESEKRWKTKSFIVPNGSELKDKTKVKFSSDKIKAVYIGRYEKYQKGLDILLEAIGKTQDILRKNKFHLEMYGVDQGNTVQELKNMLDNLKINDLVSINGSILGEEKKEKLLESDLFILSLRFEGMPMGLIEALSYGLPVIVTTGSNMRDEIEEYDAGWTADNTIDDFTKVLNRVIDEISTIKIKGQNAIKLSKNYNWDCIARKSHAEYEKLLKSV